MVRPASVGPLLTLTLVAGFASTIFAPLTAYLIGQFGWRTSYLIMAGILAAVSVPLHAFFLNQVVMTVATVTLFAVTINLIPLLLDRGIDYSTEVTALAPVSGPVLAGVVSGYPAMAVIMAVLLTATAAASIRR